MKYNTILIYKYTVLGKIKKKKYIYYFSVRVRYVLIKLIFFLNHINQSTKTNNIFKRFNRFYY